MRSIIYNFPEPYPGELFYSTIARYKFREGMNRSSIGKVLFENNMENIDFSCVKNLDKICNSIGSGITPNEIINNYSLLPIYLPFLEEQRQEDVMNYIIYNDNMKGSRIQFDELSLEKERHIMYCPKCAHEDMQQYGEPYIHREHQIPKINVCYKHGIVLEVYPFDFSKSGNLCKLDEKIMVKNPTDAGELNWKIARDAIGFLNQNQTCSKEIFIEKYRALMREAGYVYDQNLLINKKDFALKYIKYYTLEFIQLYTDISLIEGVKNGTDNKVRNWICSLQSHSIFQHVLLLNFYGISVSEFYEVNNGLNLDKLFSNHIKSEKKRKTNDEEICEQLKTRYEKQYKISHQYKELMPHEMFKSIGVLNWREIISALPLTKNYLSSVCQTKEEGDLKYCKYLVDNEFDRGNRVMIKLADIKYKFVGSNIERYEEFHAISDKVEEYINSKI